MRQTKTTRKALGKSHFSSFSTLQIIVLAIISQLFTSQHVRVDLYIGAIMNFSKLIPSLYTDFSRIRDQTDSYRQRFCLPSWPGTNFPPTW